MKIERSSLLSIHRPVTLASNLSRTLVYRALWSIVHSGLWCTVAYRVLRHGNKAMHKEALMNAYSFIACGVGAIARIGIQSDVSQPIRLDS